MIRASVVAVALCSMTAFGQYCPPYPIPGACSPSLQGNPVDGSTQTAYFRTTDFTHRMPSGDLTFERFFVSNAQAWSNWGNSVSAPMNGVPKPFGSDSAVVDGLRWWHSLFAMVNVSGLTCVARDTLGFQTEFTIDTARPGCNPVTDCWAKPSALSPSERSRLHLLTAGPELVRPDGSVLKYKANFPINGSPGPLWFLTAITNSDGLDTATVQYFGPTDVVTLPPTWTTTACTVSQKGVPFIKTVSFPGATQTTLQFHYGLAANNQECVLKQIDRRENGVSSRVVTYTY